MAGFTDSVGIIFRIAAKDDASAEIKKLSASIQGDLSSLGSKGAAELDKLTGATSTFTSAFSSLAAPVTIGIGAIAGIGAAAVTAGTALFSLAVSASEFGSKIHDIAQKTGLGAETISTLKYAAEQAGTTIEQVSTSLSIFEKNIGKAAEGGKQATETMKRLGIDPKAAINDLDGALSQVFKRISELKPGVEQTKAATDAFGRSGASLIPVISDVGGNFEEFKKKAKELGVVLTDADAAASDEFGDALDRLKSQAKGISAQFALQFMPEITGAMDEVSKFFTANQDVVKGWGEAVGKYLRDTLNEIKSQGGGWEDAGAILARRFVDGFGTIVFKGIVGAVNEAGKQTREYLANNFSLRDLIVGDKFASPVAFGRNLATFNTPAAAGTPQTFQQLEDGHQVGALGGTKSAAQIVAETAKATGEYLKNYHTEKGSKTKKEIVNELLPAIGEGFKTYGREAKTQYGTPETVDNLKLIASTFKDLTGKIIGIGDLSKKGGGDTPRHKGHEDGTTADLRPLRKDGQNLPVKISDSQYDQAATRALVELIKKVTPSAVVRFNDPDFVREGLTRRTPGHDNHLDVSNLGGKGNSVDLKKLEEDRTRDAERIVKKQEEVNAKFVKEREKADKLILDSAKDEADKERALLDQQLAQKLISETDYREAVEYLDVSALEKEKTILEERLKLTQLSADERAELENSVRSISNDISIKKIEDETAAIKRRTEAEQRFLEIRRAVADEERNLELFRADQDRKVLENTLDYSRGQARIDALVVLSEFEKKETERQQAADLSKNERERAAELKKAEALGAEKTEVEEINKLYDRRIDLINGEADARQRQNQDRTDAETRTAQGSTGKAGAAADIFGGLVGGGIDPENKIKTSAEYLKAVYGDLASSAKQAVGSMVGGLANLATQWITTGKISGKAALQMVAGIAIAYAIEAGFKALFEYAEGVALAANPFTAALAPGHFAAAAAYGVAAAAAGAVGVGTGLLSRAVGGGGSASGGAFKNQTASGNLDLRNKDGANNSSGSSGSNGEGGKAYSSATGTRTIEEDRIRRQIEPQKQIIEVHVKSRDSHILNVVHEGITGLGKLNGAIVQVVKDN